MIPRTIDFSLNVLHVLAGPLASKESGRKLIERLCLASFVLVEILAVYTVLKGTVYLALSYWRWTLQ